MCPDRKEQLSIVVTARVVTRRRSAEEFLRALSAEEDGKVPDSEFFELLGIGGSPMEDTRGAQRHTSHGHSITPVRKIPKLFEKAT